MSSGNVEVIKKDGQLLAIIIRSQFDSPGIHFFTENEHPLQLAYMRHPGGKLIQPHTHNDAERNILRTYEVLILKKGRIRVDLYTDDQKYVESKELGAGDVILLASGGHGFKVLEEIEMLEVKNGPYVGEADKTRFKGRE